MPKRNKDQTHYSDVIMSTMASPITGVSIVCITTCSGTDLRKLHSSASLAFVKGMHRGVGEFPHKGPVTRNIFPFDDIIMHGNALKAVVASWFTEYLFR